MTTWTTDDPGAGDSGAVSAWASSLAFDEDAATGIASVLAGTLGGIGSFWTGAGATGFAHTASQQKSDVEAVHQAATGAASAARTYATQVADIQRRAASQIAALSTARTAANQTYLDSPSSPPSDSVLRERAKDHADGVSAGRAATNALKALADERQHADDTFTRALRGAVPPSWPAERAAFSALGVTHPERLTEAQIDRRVTAYLDDLADKKSSDYTTADATVLLAFAQRGDISPQRVVSVLKAHPKLAAKLSGVDPNLVAVWWRGMDDLPKNSPEKGGRSKAQQALIAAIPATLGNLDGVAYWARDQANRATLRTTLASTEAELKKMEKAGPPAQRDLQHTYAKRYSDLTRLRRALINVDVSTTSATSRGPARQLIALTSAVPPLAAISLGDLDEAANVTYMVPGMGSSTEEMKGWADASQHVFSRQETIAKSDDIAVVAWVGYKSPPRPSLENPSLGVLHGDSARAGAQRLAAALEGLNACRRGTKMSLNVVAHSYGTTTASLALSQHRLRVDSFVSVASAGIERSIPNAGAIHAKHVYAEQARSVIPGLEKGVGDEWAWTGRDFSGRTNPMNADFGAQRLNADGNPSRPDQHGVTAHDGLLNSADNTGFGYFDFRTESLNNIALATTGQGDKASSFKAPALTPLQQGILDSLNEQDAPL